MWAEACFSLVRFKELMCQMIRKHSKQIQKDNKQKVNNKSSIDELFLCGLGPIVCACVARLRTRRCVHIALHPRRTLVLGGAGSVTCAAAHAASSLGLI